MKQWSILLIACIVVAYQLNSASAQFSFSLPGKWGNGKRSFSFSLPGRWGASGKRAAEWGSAECGKIDPDSIMAVYASIQVS
jgi:hypothetical protein